MFPDKIKIKIFPINLSLFGHRNYLISCIGHFPAIFRSLSPLIHPQMRCFGFFLFLFSKWSKFLSTQWQIFLSMHQQKRFQYNFLHNKVDLKPIQFWYPDWIVKISSEYQRFTKVYFWSVQNKKNNMRSYTQSEVSRLWTTL